jgi:hypothetical protein
VGFAEVNGVRLAYRVLRKGPPLVPVMGYRAQFGRMASANGDALS